MKIKTTIAMNPRTGLIFLALSSGCFELKLVFIFSFYDDYFFAVLRQVAGDFGLAARRLPAARTVEFFL